ncbi:hypothetical protein H6504_05525 [Candidatus Woesearchaeota archaeon]|nr:hypothetical protein [Candidatus Woesearchaeota archaeon]
MDNKALAIISYITIIGWVIALILDTKKDPLVRYHLRQYLMIFLVGLVLGFIPIIGWILNIVVLVFWIMGLIYAIQGQKKAVPILGDLAQKHFTFI